MNIIDAHEFLRFAAALIFVLALMGGLTLVLRRFNHMQAGNIGLPRKRRLKIVEVLPIDGRRRLVLLRRDDREHLVMLGADGETVIETGIECAQDRDQDVQMDSGSPHA